MISKTTNKKPAAPVAAVAKQGAVKPGKKPPVAKLAHIIRGKPGGPGKMSGN